MSGVPGYFHKVQISAASDDDAAVYISVATHAYKARSGLVVPTVETRFHDNRSEGGRTTSLPEAVGQPISVDMAFSQGYFGYADAIAHMLFLGANPGASVAATIVGVTSRYTHEYGWPGTTPEVFISTFMEVLARNVTDANQNRDLQNVILESVSLSGSRDNPVELSCNWRAGGFTGTGAAGTPALSIITSRLLTFGMLNLYHSQTPGFKVAPTHPWSIAHVIADSDLAGTPVDLSPYIQSFNLTFSKAPDVPRSKAPGLTDANGAGIVPDALNYIVAANQPDATLELVLDSMPTDAAAPGNLIPAFMRDKEAATLRGFELWLEEHAASEAGAFLGSKITMGRMQCIESPEQERGGAAKDISTTWKPIYDATEGIGAHISTCSQIAVALGT